MRHEDIWNGLDALARAHGLSTSALAKKAGLDATAFNPSKRVGSDGRPRWPSTESVARALEAVGADLRDLADMVTGHSPSLKVPVIGFAEAGLDGFFDAGGLPTGKGWGQVAFPLAGRHPNNADVFALEISGNSMLPAFRPGDRIIVSPSAPVAPGDRVVARTRDGEVMAKQVHSVGETHVELQSLNDAFPPRRLAREAISWLARIKWVSQ